jgi:hypothetical protein
MLSYHYHVVIGLFLYFFFIIRYDSRAGFWGVIGGPCRGIIPVSCVTLTDSNYHLIMVWSM